MSEIALLVHTCDRYKFLYKGFNIFFNKYWDFKIPTTNYFATEKEQIKLNSFITIHSGVGEWSDRLICLLSKIKEDYIIYMQEDMWLSKRVSSEFFTELFEYVREHDVDCIKLHSSEVYSTTETGTYIGGMALSIVDPEKSNFLMSHQISLWKKSFLSEQLKSNEHPWRNERRGSKRLKRTKPLMYQIDCFSENGKGAINKNLSDSLRSEYFTVSVNASLDFRVFIFIQMLRTSYLEREYCQDLIEHFEKGLTHDCAAPQKKIDFIKRSKAFFKQAFS
ncbi:MAG: hypothetical protein R2852_05720 [Bacteroidia bacterium]